MTNEHDESTIDELREEIGSLEDENGELKGEVAELVKEVERLQEELEATEAALDDEEAGSSLTFDLWKLREAEAERLKAVLVTITETAREQTIKSGAPVEHALDFIVALDRILSDAVEAIEATTSSNKGNEER